MPAYKCINPKCESFEKEVRTSGTKLYFDKDFEVIDEYQDCPECSKTRQTIKEDGFTTQIHGSTNIPL